MSFANNTAEYYIADIAFEDYENGTLRVNFEDAGDFKDEDGKTIDPVAIGKMGRKLYLADFDGQMFSNEKKKVVAASDIYDHVEVVYEISNPDIASINAEGVIEPKKAGTTRVSLTNGKTGDKAFYELRIIDPYLQLVNTRLVIFKNNTKTFKAEPMGYSGADLSWSSSDPSVLTVDGKGNVTGVSAGTAVITVSDKTSGYETSVEVKCIDGGQVDYSKYIVIKDHPDIDIDIARKVEELLYTVYQPGFDFFNYGEFRTVTIRYDYIDDPGVAAYAYFDENGPQIVVGIEGMKGGDYDSLTHELIHTAQDYPFTTTSGEDVTWLGEGLTDYGRYLFGIWNDRTGWNLQKYREGQHYTDSYTVTGGFIKYVVDNYDSDFAVKLNDAFKQEKYSHELWKTATGYSIDELWDRYSKGIK